MVDLPNVQSTCSRNMRDRSWSACWRRWPASPAKVGFVGGMDIPLIRRFECGYEQGAKYANKDAAVMQNMTGTTGGLERPDQGRRACKGQFDQGVDVSSPRRAAPASASIRRQGQWQAGDRRRFNQNHIQPGTMLTSMMKRRRRRGHDTAKAAKDGTWKAGVTELGLAQSGVDWALDDDNKSLVTAEMKEKSTPPRRHHRRQDQGP